MDIAHVGQVSHARGDAAKHSNQLHYREHAVVVLQMKYANSMTSQYTK